MDVDLDPDDFAFCPTAWDLAVAVGIGIDPENDRPALDELADAMLVGMGDGEQLEQLTSTALAAIWSDELEAMIREGLERLRGQEEWRAGAEEALVELAADPRAAGVSREVVRDLAVQLSRQDVPFLFCLHCLEEAIATAPAADRRALATQVAIVARRDAGVPDRELSRLARAPAEAAAFGTMERRAAVRRRVRRVAAFGAGSVPALAAELAAILDEPLPADAVDDDLWQVAAVALLAEVAAPELN